MSEAMFATINKNSIKEWLLYWSNASMVNFDAIRAFEHVYQARKFCSCMRVGIFSSVTDLQIWNALREIRDDLGEWPLSVDDHVKVFLDEIQDAEIREPRAGEFVDSCHYSKTGFAIWRHEGERKWCTCNPAAAPEYELTSEHDGDTDV